MTLITAKCPSCQTAQELPPWGMLLEAGVDDGDSDADATAIWICGTCRQLVITPIDLTVLLNLLAAGVPLVAAEPDDAAAAQSEHVAAGPPLTFDELIDFHESLFQEDADILAELGGDTDLCRDC